MPLFEALQINAESVNQREEDLRLAIRELSDEQRKAYYARFNKEMKDPDTYAVLNWFFLAGLHHMYLGDYVRGAINLAVLIWGIILLFTWAAIIGILMIVAVLVLELMALFRSQAVVTHHNNKVAGQILGDMGIDC